MEKPRFIRTESGLNEHRGRHENGTGPIFLLRLLDRLHPNDPEIEGALALVLLTDARRQARIGADGATVPPEHQDRSLWNTHHIREGQELLSKAVQRGRPGPFQIKAAIADCHMAKSKPDWPQISLLYGSLWHHEPTPVVALNWAVVMMELGQDQLALQRIEALQETLCDFQPFYAAYASVLARNGRKKDARQAYDKAIDMAPSAASKVFLITQRDGLK